MEPEQPDQSKKPCGRSPGVALESATEQPGSVLCEDLLGFFVEAIISEVELF